MDYGKKPWFHGPVARTVGRLSPLFIMIPVGLLSIAGYLIENGFGARIVNLAEHVLESPNFRVDEYIKGIDSRIFAIDLHWDVHSHGAIALAQICKQQHPDSFVLLGGLTASYFSQEIVSSFQFIDGVIRGEAEKPMVTLARAIAKNSTLDQVPNLTHRQANGHVRINPQAEPERSIDHYDFTNLALVDPKKVLLNIEAGLRSMKLWNLPVCRGCTLNCVTCGGSQHAYQRIFKREKPAFRSPERLVDDFHALDNQGINSIFLFQDCRLGSKSYYENLLRRLHNEKWSNIQHITLELFHPASDEFVRYLARNKPADKITLTNSPESGCDRVRQLHGRNYDNQSILNTVAKCKANSLPIIFHFMIGLGSESTESLNEMWTLWDKILSRKKHSGFFTSVDVGPMILMDPGSIAYENPANYGYRMLAVTFSEMYRKLSAPIWTEWINYETRYMRKSDIVQSVFESMEKLIDVYEKYGIYDRTTAYNERMRNKLEKNIAREAQDALNLLDPKARSQKLKELHEIYRDPLLSYSYVMTCE